MSHRRILSTASTVSFAPVLIRPTGVPVPPSAQPPPRLRYPYPLPIVSLADLAYTVHHAIRDPTESGLLLTSILRVIFLGGVVGMSRGWRGRGGWAAAACGGSVGAAVWDACASQLRQSRDRGDARAEQKHGQMEFLGIRAFIAVAEYLLFLILLRLSPPPHRGNLLSFRRTSTAIQSATPFSYTEHSLPISPSHPRTPRKPLGAHLSDSHSPPNEPGISSVAQQQLETEGEGVGQGEYRDSSGSECDVETSYDPEEDSFSSSSSLSSSSIVDLPPPLSPNRIVPPPSLSIRSGLSLHATLEAVEAAPVLGSIVRRTRSLKVLGRSLGGRDWDGGEVGERREGERGRADSYGTFGREEEV